jgi:hypothetical protein
VKRKFKNEKDLRLFLRKFFKERLKHCEQPLKLEVKVERVTPPKAKVFLPFHSEGNLIRLNEVDFFLKELSDQNIEVELYYEDEKEAFDTCAL